jgi:phenylpropionate dioxygenase-like ring-hydroxylating dioxygenase large terminal subunit
MTARSRPLEARVVAAPESGERPGWVEIASLSDLPARRPVIAVTIGDQRMVLFRDNDGRLGLISRNCPHRGADLCFGRREDNGLRCPFHGWHFDHTGQCVEQPAEPQDSTMYRTIKLPSFPVVEHGGAAFAWLGEGVPPAIGI